MIILYLLATAADLTPQNLIAFNPASVKMASFTLGSLKTHAPGLRDSQLMFLWRSIQAQYLDAISDDQGALQDMAKPIDDNTMFISTAVANVYDVQLNKDGIAQKDHMTTSMNNFTALFAHKGNHFFKAYFEYMAEVKNVMVPCQWVNTVYQVEEPMVPVDILVFKDVNRLDAPSEDEKRALLKSTVKAFKAPYDILVDDSFNSLVTFNEEVNPKASQFQMSSEAVYPAMMAIFHDLHHLFALYCSDQNPIFSNYRVTMADVKQEAAHVCARLKAQAGAGMHADGKTLSRLVAATEKVNDLIGEVLNVPDDVQKVIREAVMQPVMGVLSMPVNDRAKFMARLLSATYLAITNGVYLNHNSILRTLGAAQANMIKAKKLMLAIENIAQ